jgi:hypothetical protein
MEPIRFGPSTDVPDDHATLELAEIDAAIGMVAGGLARRICLVALAHPEAIAAVALARAQAADVGFHLDRDPGGAVRLTFGPPHAAALRGPGGGGCGGRRRTTTRSPPG